MVRTFAVAVFSLIVVAQPLTAHPLHTSFTEIARERTGHVAISIRLFADDFGATLDSLSKLPAARGSAPDAVARAYFERSVALVDRSGAQVPLTWCGMSSTEGLTFLCARSVEPVSEKSLRFRNKLMFDRFSDQLSIVRWTEKSKVTTRVLSSRAPEATFD